ncbi:heat shock factor protein HSF8-like [Magnolia sinica]|uniref:heat shock factor protein HSF8-like n=1 Tax=Magnolia sinica TaxID=86752 RepID=UPI0026580F58|nr:heat shock factor protein HSF8-like [Magnolia sinica]
MSGLDVVHVWQVDLCSATTSSISLPSRESSPHLSRERPSPSVMRQTRFSRTNPKFGDPHAVQFEIHILNSLGRHHDFEFLEESLSMEATNGNSSNLPPPFLSKCYDMVDDQATDPTVSWSVAGDSFVVWDQSDFSRDLLPKYFKHNNFSSFVRQLNTYGFRKVDSDRWEFANEGFCRGQKHLLKSISRRKPIQGPIQQRQSQEKNTSAGPCVEIARFGFEEAIENLKRDRNMVMQELVKLRQHQQSTDNQLLDLRRRLQGMEQHQQQMLSFFVMAMQRPGFFAQLLQQSENSWRIVEASKKRRLPALEHGIEDENAASNGQIVTYQPPTIENAKPLLMPMSDTMDVAPWLDSFSTGVNEFFENVDWTSLGINTSLPMEVALPSLETDGEFIFPEISNDELEQLLLATSGSENDEENKSNTLESMQFELMEHETQSETTPQNLDVLTEQMGLLASEMNEEGRLMPNDKEFHGV